MVIASTDQPAAQLAMNHSWHLPFRWISDPGGERCAKPLDAWNPDEHGGVFHPLVLLIAPDGNEAYRHRSTDFADRRDDGDMLGALEGLGLAAQPTPSDWQPEGVEPRPTDAAFRPQSFSPYYLGVQFSSRALRGRMRDDRDAEEAATTMAMAQSFLGAWKQRRAEAGEPPR